MNVKIITNTIELENIQEKWNVLQERSMSTFYDTYQFKSAWWSSYKDDSDKSLFVITVFENDKLIGLAPLLISSKKENFISYKELEFLGEGDYRNVLIDVNNNSFKILNLIFKTIEDNKDKWDRVNLTHISNNTDLAKYILTQTKYNKYLKYLVECPILNFNKYFNFEEYKKEFVSSSANKYRNKLKREIGYRFKVIKENSIFDEIVELHKKEQKYLNYKNKSKNRYSLYEDPKRYKYIEELYSKSQDIITFIIEDMDGNIIIYDTCYLWNKVLHSWNMAFDPKYQKYNVGRIINFEIMMYAFENKEISMFDFGCGRYPWKFEWTDEVVFNYQLDIWNNISLYRKVNIIKQVKNLIKSIIKK